MKKIFFISGLIVFLFFVAGSANAQSQDHPYNCGCSGYTPCASIWCSECSFMEDCENVTDNSCASLCASGQCSGGSCVSEATCNGTDISCGTPGNCVNCNNQDGCYSGYWRDYSCSVTSCTYTQETNCRDGCCVVLYGPGAYCDNGVCRSACTPNCTGRECGSDGCSGSCPPGCSSGETCIGGVCQTASQICADNYTDGGTPQETGNASYWCSSGFGLFSCLPNTGQSYDFCVGANQHAHVACRAVGTACSCNGDSSYIENCPGGCIPWDCTRGTGCTGGECRRTAPCTTLGHTDPHNACSGSTCTSVSGCGPNTCTTNNDCSGGTASITVTSPSGGESWVRLTTHEITWTSQGYSGNVYISLYGSGGEGWYGYITESTPNDGSYSWNITEAVGTRAIVISADVPSSMPTGMSGDFEIVPESGAAIPHIGSISPTQGPSNTLITINGTNFNSTPNDNRIRICDGEQQCALSLEQWELAAVRTAASTYLTFNAPYKPGNTVITIVVESRTQSGMIRSDNSANFTITEACPTSPTGCECMQDTLVEGGCTYGHCSSQCGTGFVGISCIADIDCTPASQCSSPNQCSQPTQSCTSLGSGWRGTRGTCSNGGTCCSPCPNSNCDPGECDSCPEDCAGRCCGDGRCQTDIEDATNCPADCRSPCDWQSGACGGTSGTITCQPMERLLTCGPDNCSGACVGGLVRCDPDSTCGGCPNNQVSPHLECVDGTCRSLPTCGTNANCTVGAACTGGRSPGRTIRLFNPFNFSSFQELVDNLIDFIFTIGVILAPLMYLIAGFYFMTAAGDSQKVTIAKNIALYTTIGLGILLFARGLIAVISSVLGR